MALETRRLIQLQVLPEDVETDHLFDKLLAKKRAADRKFWLEQKGNLANAC